MRSMLKFLLALVLAFVGMILFRALAFTIYTVPGSQFEPTFKSGDRVMVNRWSYGLRTGGGGLFPYGRLCHQPVDKGDWVAVSDSADQILLGRCSAQPGDTVCWQQRTVVVPGRDVTCAHHDYYLVDSVGLVREEQIIGRVVLVVYNHAHHNKLWQGYDATRLLLPL